MTDHTHDNRALEDRLRSLSEGISSAQSKRAREEVELKHAEEALAAGKAKLQEFGITTADDLRERLAALEGDFARELETAEELLAKAGG